MATPPAAVRDYCVLLAKSRLVPAGEVEALYKQWRTDHRGADDQIEAFGKFLTGKRVLTSWQAALISRGRAEGFFLDGYKILEQLGKGQMGGVYKAVHSLGQLVAIKILPASRSKDARLLGRFQREARLLTQLDHPNVVRAFQFGETGGRHYIVMEFLDGETLDEVLTRRKRLPIEEAARLVRQALDGLEHLHERKMVHRDLKPANLMICPAGKKGAADTTWEATVKILDIGLGRALLDDSTPTDLVEPQFTMEGSVVGTPDYMAPEQAKDARFADIRADIYSLGCVLFHSLTGKPPFPDTNIMAQMLRHATDPAPRLAAVLGDVPAGLQPILDRMLAKQPEQRFSTPAEASAALEPFQKPGAGATAARTAVVPEFRQWLESESMLDVKKSALSPTAGLSAPGTDPAEPLRRPTTAKPAAAAPPPFPPVPGAFPSPPSNPHPHIVGSFPAPGAYPMSTPAAPTWQPATPFPAPTMPPPVEEEVEVELVTMPPPAPISFPVEVPPPPKPEERPLWELDRRDLFLLGVGGGGVLGAVGMGYLLARLVRGLKSSPAEPEPTDEK